MRGPTSASSPVDSYQQCLDYCFQKSLTNCAECCGPDQPLPEETSKPFSWSDHRTVQAMATIANPYTITGGIGTMALIEATGGWIGGSVTAATLLLPVGTSAYYHYGKYSAGEESAVRAAAHVAGDTAVSLVAHIGGIFAGIGAGGLIGKFGFAPLSAILVGGAVARTATTADFVYYLTDPTNEAVDYYMNFAE